MRKRILSIILMLCMVLTLFPTVAWAGSSMSVYVGGTELTLFDTDETIYAVVDEGVVTTNGASADNYNVKFELVNTVPTLTLNDFTYAGAGFDYDDGTAVKQASVYFRYYEDSATLTIKPEGTNTIENTGGTSVAESAAIYAKGNLTITGDGTLTITGGEAYGDSFGVRVGSVDESDNSLGGVLTMSGCIVDATGGAANGYSYGIYAGDDISIITGSEITAAGGWSYSGSCAIFTEQNVSISGSSEVNAEGGAAPYSGGISVGEALTIGGGKLVAMGGASDESDGTVETTNTYGISAAEISLTSGTVIAQGHDLEMDENESFGVYAGNITVGGGTLTAIGGSAGFGSYGIFVLRGGAITYQNGALIAQSGESSYESMALSAAPALPGMYVWRTSDSGVYTTYWTNAGTAYSYSDEHNHAEFHRVVITPASLDFGSATEGYAAPDGQVVLAYDYSGDTPSLCILDASGSGTSDDYSSQLNLPRSFSPYGDTRFYVHPKAGLSVGSHNAILAFTDDSGNIIAKTELLFTVSAAPVTQYTITASANPTAGGTVSGGGTFNANTSRTVEATANAGYHFVRWTEGGAQVSTSASYTFTLTANRNLVAVFEADTPMPSGGDNNDYTPPAVTIYNDPNIPNATIWLTGGNLPSGDLLITDTLTSGSGYNALLRLTDNGNVMGMYDISLKSGKTPTGSAMHLHFALGKSLAGQTFTLVHLTPPDGTPETFTATADANGNVSFGPLYSLSPFMLVRGTLLQMSVVPVVDIPKTGDASTPAGYIMMAVVGLAAASIMLGRRNRHSR